MHLLFLFSLVLEKERRDMRPDKCGRERNDAANCVTIGRAYIVANNGTSKECNMQIYDMPTRKYDIFPPMRYTLAP